MSLSLGLDSQYAHLQPHSSLSCILFQPDDLNALNVIHITGTKGKGSTSAFTDSILRHARPGMKVGMFHAFLCHPSSQSTQVFILPHTLSPSVNGSESMADPCQRRSLQNIFSKFGQSSKIIQYAFFLRLFRLQTLDLRVANYSRISTHAWLFSIPDSHGIPYIQGS